MPSSRDSYDYSGSAPRVLRFRHSKSGPKLGRKSAIVDGDFINELWVSGYFDPPAGGGHVVVYSHPPITFPRSFNPLTPRPWERTTEGLKAIFYHDALRHHPNVKAFTLMLSDGVERACRDQGKHCLASLHRRIAKELKRAVGASQGIQWWFCIEESPAGVLHCHGEVSFDPSDEELVRKGLKVAGGVWTGKGRQLRFAKTNPDFRWAGYAAKNVSKASPLRRRFMRRFGSPQQWVAGFDGKAVTASQDLVRQARTVYERAVAGIRSATVSVAA